MPVLPILAMRMPSATRAPLTAPTRAVVLPVTKESTALRILTNVNKVCTPAHHLHSIIITLNLLNTPRYISDTGYHKIEIYKRFQNNDVLYANV